MDTTQLLVEKPMVAFVDLATTTCQHLCNVDTQFRKCGNVSLHFCRKPFAFPWEYHCVSMGISYCVSASIFMSHDPLLWDTFVTCTVGTCPHWSYSVHVYVGIHVHVHVLYSVHVHMYYLHKCMSGCSYMYMYNMF